MNNRHTNTQAHTHAHKHTHTLSHHSTTTFEPQTIAYMQNPERGEVVGPVRDVESAAEHISRGYSNRSCFYESTLEI